MREIYRVSSLGPFAKDFRLRDQIRRAGVSVMSNIAEGFESSGTAEFVQFLAIAKGSVGEVLSQLFVAADQHYINTEQFDRLVAMGNETSRMIAGRMNYLRKSGVKGVKFR